MDSLFQNLNTIHLLEVLIIILGSAVFGWLIAMYLWKKRLNNASNEWEMRFNAKARDYNELRNLYSNLDKQHKETEHQVSQLESRVTQETSQKDQLSVEKQNLGEQLKHLNREKQELRLKISDLEIVRKKHGETVPKLETAKQEIETLKRQLSQLESQKKELNLVVNSLKDYRAKAEDLHLQLHKSQQRIEELEQQCETLREAVKTEGERGPRVLELSGRLRWALSENVLIKERLNRLDNLVDNAAFSQLAVDGKVVYLQQELAAVPEAEEKLVAFQHKVWEKEGELRWAEQEKQDLQKKISELEFAKASLPQPVNGQPLPPEQPVSTPADPSPNTHLDARGQLTHIALKLESEQEQANRLLEQTTELERHILELKGRSNWMLSEKELLKAEGKRLQADLELARAAVQTERAHVQNLENSLKTKQEELIELTQKVETDQLAQALIDSEERETLKSQLEGVQESAYQAAQDQVDLLAGQSRLSLANKQVQKHLEALEAERLTLLDEIGSLKETTYGAAQEQWDRLAENSRLTWENRQAREKAIAWESFATSLEEEKTALLTQLESLQASIYAAAQERWDFMAEQSRMTLSNKHKQHHLEALEISATGLEQEKVDLLSQLEALRESTYGAAQTHWDQEALNTRFQLQVRDLKQQVEELQHALEEKAQKGLEISQQLEALQEKDLSKTQELLVYQQELEALQHSTYAAAQNQADYEAENTRLGLSLKELQLQLESSQDTIHLAAQLHIDEQAAQARSNQQLSLSKQKLVVIQEELQSEKEQLYQEIVDLRTAVEKADEQLSQQEQLLEHLHTDLHTAQEALQSSTQEVAAEKSAFQELKDAFEQTYRQMQLTDKAYQELQESTQNAALENANLEAELTRQSLEYRRTVAQVSQLEVEITRQQEALKSERQSHERWEVLTQDLQNQLQARDQNNEGLVQQLTDARNQLQLVQSQQRETESKLSQLNSQLQEALREKTEKESQIATLEARVESLSQDNLPAATPWEETTPATVSFALELTEAEKDEIRQRIFARRDWVELNFGRIGIASPSEKDELQAIQGIDEFTEERLNMVQIFTYRQLGNFTDEEIEVLTDTLELTPGIITQQEWVSQARNLF